MHIMINNNILHVCIQGHVKDGTFEKCIEIKWTYNKTQSIPVNFNKLQGPMYDFVCNMYMYVCIHVHYTLCL